MNRSRRTKPDPILSLHRCQDVHTDLHHSSCFLPTSPFISCPEAKMRTEVGQRPSQQSAESASLRQRRPCRLAGKCPRSSLLPLKVSRRKVLAANVPTSVAPQPRRTVSQSRRSVLSYPPRREGFPDQWSLWQMHSSSVASRDPYLALIRSPNPLLCPYS